MSQPRLIEIARDGQAARSDRSSPATTAGRSPHRFSTGIPSPSSSDACSAEALLPRHQRVAVVQVLHVARLQILRAPDVVVRADDEARPFALEELATASISSGAASCSVTM